jgi:hypothetical protein
VHPSVSRAAANLAVHAAWMLSRGNLQAILRQSSGNLQPSFKQAFSGHPIFPSINNTRPD